MLRAGKSLLRDDGSLLSLVSVAKRLKTAVIGAFRGSFEISQVQRRADISPAAPTIAVDREYISAEQTPIHQRSAESLFDKPMRLVGVVVSASR